jgi:hypothetical protein
MKNSYTYSEIIFSAREEYGKIREKIIRLNELANIKMKKYVAMHYNLEDFYEYRSSIKKENIDEFDKLIEDVMNSKFRQTSIGMRILDIEMNKHFDLWDDYIHASISWDNKAAINMHYRYLEDYISFVKFPLEDNFCNDRTVMMFLNHTVKSKRLSEELCSIIDSSQSAHKEIKIYSQFNQTTNPSIFDIEQTDNSILLIRRFRNK